MRSAKMRTWIFFPVCSESFLAISDRASSNSRGYAFLPSFNSASSFSKTSASLFMERISAEASCLSFSASFCTSIRLRFKRSISSPVIVPSLNFSISHKIWFETISTSSQPFNLAQIPSHLFLLRSKRLKFSSRLFNCSSSLA